LAPWSASSSLFLCPWKEARSISARYGREQRSGKWDFGEQPALFAVAQAILRAMLEAGGNPNTRNEFGRPMILMNWYLGYYPDQASSRLDLLLNHGADVNSGMPEDGSDSSGYPLLLYRTKMGLDDKLAYADALAMLKRAADPNRVGADGMTFAKMLMEHRAHFGRTLKQPPAEFAALWDWAEKHGIIQTAR